MNLTKKILTIVAVLMLAATGTTGVHAAPTEKISSIEAASFIESLTTPEETPAVTAPPKTEDVKKSASTTPIPKAPVEAPVEPAPVEVPQPPVEAPPVIQVQSLPSAPVAAPAPAPVPVQAPAPVASHGSLASAALAQLGIQQDCTRMVENALASIGRPVGDLAPAGFLSVGVIVAGPPQAGDILVYGGHVAIALGNGQAVHGGFNGGTTAIGPVDVGQGVPTVVRV